MRVFEKGELSLLWPFYLNAIISTMFYFIAAFITVYFLSIGLNLFQVGLITSVASLAALLFEIPTGAVADIYGRKFSVLLAMFLQAIIFILIMLTTNFYIILILIALMGLSGTFASGADEAWVIDLIKKENKKLLHNFFIKLYSLASLGMIVSGLLGALLVKKFGIAIVWPASALAMLFAVVILSFGKEHYKKKRIKIKQSLKELKNQARKSIEYSYRHSVLFYLLMAGLVMVFVGAMASSISWIPLLRDLNFPDYAFGYMWSAMGLIAMIAPWFSKKLLKKNKERDFIIWTLAAYGIITFFIVFVNGLFTAFLIFGLGLFFLEMRSPVRTIYFHKFIPSKLRATIGSVENMIIAFGAIISMPLAGFLVDKMGPKIVIFVSALLVMPAIFLYLKIKEKK